jgi:hypothetical protein
MLSANHYTKKTFEEQQQDETKVGGHVERLGQRVLTIGLIQLRLDAGWEMLANELFAGRLRDRWGRWGGHLRRHHGGRDGREIVLGLAGVAEALTG